MLTDVPDDELERLLRGLDAGSISAPLSAIGASRHGLRKLGVLVGELQALDAAALSVLAHAVLAERRARPQRPELVWTGPEGTTARGRSTEVVFRRLLQSAERDVWIAGYSIDHGEELFRPLHEAMAARGVSARFLLHPKYDWREQRAGSVDEGADLILNRFLTRNWPFGAPYPELYYDPRPLEANARSSMHVKAVVVDEMRVLIGSANFTKAGQERNFEAGVYLEDASFAVKLVTQLRSLVDAGLVRRHGARG